MKVHLRWAIPAAVILTVLVAAFAVPGARRRAHLVWLVATGEIPDVKPADVVRMLPPKSGYDVEALVNVRNPYVTIRNPHTEKADVEAGSELFRAQCASCHGGHGGGGAGPDLTTGQYRHGPSDWAVYRTIILGVPGTAMTPHPLPSRAVWQLVAYLRSVAGGTGAGIGGSQVIDVTYEHLQHANLDSANWLTYSGSYDGRRHSRLAQVTPATVGRLKLKWIYQFPTNDNKVETSPIVVGSTMYVTSPPSSVSALDAGTGVLRWSFERPLTTDPRSCCGRVNRGLAVEGGTLFLATMDAHLIALDAATGAVRWDIQVADATDGYTITGAPLAVDGRVITGVGGGDFGIRGFLDAYDARTGRRLWRFNTVPGPGEAGHETWAGSSWKTGSSPTWMTGTFDPETQTLYWGVGNPGPDYQGDVRPGDNLYSNSVLALDVDSGRLKWYYQFTPHDEHDWDATQIPVLVDADLNGTRRKLLVEGNRNGFYYVLDRETGAFLTAKPFVRQSWAAGFDSAGRPLVLPGSSPSPRGNLTWPSHVGATNWWPPSYDNASGLFFVWAVEGPGVFFKSGDPVRGEGQFLGSAGQGSSTDPLKPVVRALEATSGDLRWEYDPHTTLSSLGGVLSTSGKLVLVGVGPYFLALDSRSGAELWRVNLGGNIHAAPITYLSDGLQQITIAAGRAIFTFALDGR
jgi:alcohol dehydrogenase (cytochrome c)